MSLKCEVCGAQALKSHLIRGEAAGSQDWPNRQLCNWCDNARHRSKWDAREKAQKFVDSEGEAALKAWDAAHPPRP